MTIAIIIEDGSLVEGANSYESLENVRAYALNRGITLSAVDDELAAMVIKSTDYLEAQACRYQGSRVSVDQSLQFPRAGVILNEDEVPYNVIPNCLKSAQSQLVMALHEGFDLLPTISPQDYVVREKVGPVDTQYADPLQVGMTPVFTAVDALLAPLFGVCASNKFILKTVRV